MRKAAAWTAVMAWAIGCSSSSSSSTDTCAFAKDTNNCWHAFVKSVDACLTDDAGPDAGPRPVGQMSSDGKSCTYSTGRNVTFAIDPRITDSGSGASEPDRDVTVTVGGTTCLHFVRDKGNMTFVGPGGTVSETSAGVVTCPDGSTHTLGLDVENCLDAAFAGGLPGTLTTSSGSSWSLQLVGATKAAYNCTASAPAPGP